MKNPVLGFLNMKNCKQATYYPFENYAITITLKSMKESHKYNCVFV